MKKFSYYLSWARNIVWPIYGKENLKFISLLLMMSSSIFCYTILRILKDAYILSAPLASANSISFVKVYFVLPISLLYIMYFFYLTTKFSKENVFLFSVLPLIIFFSSFYLIFFPNLEYFHMSVSTVKYYQEHYPSLKNFIPIIGYWVFSVFYVFSELVGTVVITFLFWNFATYCAASEEQAKRFFPLFVVYSYTVMMIGTYVIDYVFKSAAKFPKGSKEYFDALFLNFYLVIGSLIVFLAFYYFINSYVLTEEEVRNKSFKIKKKNEGSFIDSIKTVLKSKYILSIALLIICYGITSNLLEVTWKELIREEFHGDESLIIAYLSRFYFSVSFYTITLGFLNNVLLTTLGWGCATVLVPLVLMITSFMFFFLIVFGALVPSWMLYGFSASCFAMHIGFYQDGFIKGGRYSVLDPNMQMAYMPLEENIRIKGKASVDLIGSRVGKSIGSFLESSFSMLCNGANQIALAPIFMPIVLLSCGIWIFVVIYIASVYKKLIEQEKREQKKA